MTHTSGLVPTSPVGARALYCTADGVFVWPRTPLIRRRPNPGRGSHFAKCDPLTAWRHLVPWHGEDVNGSRLAGTLTSACAYLNAGDPAEARKWVDRLPLPPLTQHALAKLGHWQMQPRAPVGSSEGGRWVAEAGGGGFRDAVWNPDDDADAQTVADPPRLLRPPPGIGHNGPPLVHRLVPPMPPSAGAATGLLLRSAVLGTALLLRELLLDGGPQDLIDAIRHLVHVPPEEAANFASAQEMPDYPEKLHPPEDGSRPSTPGYEWHHIVEQTSGSRDFGREAVEDRTNLIRIPKYVHESVSNWYATKNDDLGGMTPRAYLRGKSFEEQRELALGWLRELRVIK